MKDDKHKCTLGNLTVPLSVLLGEEDMTLTQGFPLKNSGPSSIIKLKMALRVSNAALKVLPVSPPRSGVQDPLSLLMDPKSAASARKSANSRHLQSPECEIYWHLEVEVRIAAMS